VNTEFFGLQVLLFSTLTTFPMAELWCIHWRYFLHTRDIMSSGLALTWHW